MQSNRRETSLELEIQSLLILHGSSDQAVTELLKKYGGVPLDLEQAELISIFCLHAGMPAALLEFLRKQIALDGAIPWGHFAEAFALAQDKFDPDGAVAEAMYQGASEQKMLWHLARTRVFDSRRPEFAQERDMRKRAQEEKAQALKRDLLMQVDTLRSQELEDEEGQLLEKIMRMFPRDSQTRALYQEHRARKALRLLEQKSARPPESRAGEFDPEPDSETKQLLDVISKAMRDAWKKNKESAQMGVDFAVAQWMWENWDSSLDFLPAQSLELSARWLRADVLLRTRRYVLLLSELIELEKLSAQDPDVTFAVSYLRAQALWGMTRKFEAIEILEGIVNVKPSYRSAAALLAIWRGPSL